MIGLEPWYDKGSSLFFLPEKATDYKIDYNQLKNS